MPMDNGLWYSDLCWDTTINEKHFECESDTCNCICHEDNVCP